MYRRARDQCRIQESWHVSIHTLKVCENLKMDILDFESPFDMLNIAVKTEEVITIQTIKECKY